jgi:hypothetical protein
MKGYITFILACVLLPLGAQTGPGGVGTNDGTSALKVWLDAGKDVFTDTLGKNLAQDSSRIMFWADLSGSGHHVKAKSDSTRPQMAKNNSLFNAQNAIRFSRIGVKGNKRNYLASDSFAYTNDISIYCVFRALSPGGGNDASPFKVKVTAPNDTSWYSGSGLVDADVFDPKDDISMALNDTSLAVGGGDSVSKIDYTVKIPLQLKQTSFGTLTRELSSTLLSVSKNGGIPNTFLAGTQPINNSVRYTIGATSNSIRGTDVNFFDGYIASVLVYNKKLSEAETIILENYLSAKYGIVLERHDFFKADDPSQGNYDLDLAGIGMGMDNLPQLSAKGEGLIGISNPSQMGKGEYLMWATDTSSFNFQNSDIPEGVKQRIMKTWKIGEVGETGLVELTVDTKSFLSADQQDVVLLVDADNNNSFENEHVGEGMYIQSKYLGKGIYQFKNVTLNNENRFTFGILTPTCQSDCDAAFSPNGDGISDTYFLENAGKTVIYDKYGQTIKELKTPAYWDGSKLNGEVANPGIYFIVCNETQQKTVTLVR